MGELGWTLITYAVVGVVYGIDRDQGVIRLAWVLLWPIYLAGDVHDKLTQPAPRAEGGKTDD